MKIVLPDQHILFSSSDAIKQICKPLYKYLNINSFHYLQINPDMSRLNLGTDPEYHRLYYEKIHSYCMGIGIHEDSHCETGFRTLYSGETSDELIKDARCMGFGNGIIITTHYPKKHITEMVWFGFYANNDEADLIRALSNIDLLQQFLIYFRVKASDLIKKAAQNPIALPFLKSNLKTKSYGLTMNSKNAFLNSISINNSLSAASNLTISEKNCLAILKYGKSAKDIARQLNRSQRTIEEHIAKAKCKLRCSSVLELVSLLNRGDFQI